MNEISEKNEAVSAKPKSEFIKFLEGLTADPKRQDRAALANLRSGLRRKNFQAMEMYPYLGRFLSEKPNRNYESAVFIVAALFAYYPDAPKTKGNLGASLREYKRQTESDGAEKRFVALLNAEAEDLPNYLRQIIGLLKSKEIAVNWQRLFDAIRQWNSDDRYIQRDLARSFWGNLSPEENQTNQDTENTSGGEQQQ